MAMRAALRDGVGAVLAFGRSSDMLDDIDAPHDSRERARSMPAIISWVLATHDASPFCPGRPLKWASRRDFDYEERHAQPQY